MPGRIVMFAGLDGSGKTTQAMKLLESPELQTRGWVYRWARWEPYLTAPMMAMARRLVRRNKEGGFGRPADDAGHAAFRDGKQRLFRRGWLRGVWTVLVLLEYLPQLYWRVGPALLTGKTVVCDRYLPDVWIDLAMNFGTGQVGVNRLSRHPVSRLFPRPSVVILFDVEPRTGFERKNDGTPLGYLVDRAPLYLGLQSLMSTIRIDANSSLEAVALDVRAKVLDWDSTTRSGGKGPA